jgi:hypothetical protein
MTDHDFPNPVALLRDEKGIYGIGLSDAYLQARAGRSENIKLILRTDRIDEAILWTGAGDYAAACLQQLPPWCPPWCLPWGKVRFRGTRRFNGTQEGALRDEMIAVVRSRAGISKSSKPPHNAKERRHYFGLPIMATRMFNAMMRQVTDIADPEALRVARRFPLAMRWPIYKAGVRSHRMLQLAEAFPLLAYRIHFRTTVEQTPQENEKRELTIRMVERGAKLRNIAAVWQLPMRLRRIKPGATSWLIPQVLIDRPQLLDYMPLPLPQMRQWMHAVRFAAPEEKPDYAAWVAKNWAKLDGLHEIQNLCDWARARPRERPFTPNMSVQTVRQLSAEWHEAIVRRHEAIMRRHEEVEREEAERLGPFSEPWLPAGTLASGEAIVPITDAVELYREGRAMHHCIASYSPHVIAGRHYVYSIRQGDQRIATFALNRDSQGKITLGQIRSVCNGAVPEAITAAVRRWLASQNGRAL